MTAGRGSLIPSSKIAYAEVGSAEVRRVGFGSAQRSEPNSRPSVGLLDVLIRNVRQAAPQQRDGGLHRDVLLHRPVRVDPIPQLTLALTRPARQHPPVGS